MRDTQTPQATREAMTRTLLRLNARAWGIAVGFLLGAGLFIATTVLVLKGGHVAGPHLALLSAFLPGYRVSMAGAFIGFAYLFVVGYAIGPHDRSRLQRARVRGLA